jgi:aminodeoxyfutalosine deaminase
MNIADIPKVELHCHMDGIITPGMAADICREFPDYPVKPGDFANAFPITDQDSFWHWWQVVKPIDGQLKLYYPIVARYISRLKQQNVRYFELMIAAGEIPREPEAAVEAVQVLREFVSQQENGVIQVEFMVAFGRHGPPERVALTEKVVLRLHEAGLIVGVALAGPEIGNPVKPLQKTFSAFHDAGMNIEIHAGEWVGPESVWDALEHGYPDRIGHGVSLFQDPKLVEIFQERQIHIEICPTSNLKTGSIHDIDQHPVSLARDLGLNFSINTDDPGPFECSMNGEFELLHDWFGFTETDFATIYKNGLAARFQPELRVRI